MVRPGGIPRRVADRPLVQQQAAGLDAHPVPVLVSLGHLVGEDQLRGARAAPVEGPLHLSPHPQAEFRRPRHFHRLAEGDRHPDLLRRRVDPVRPRIGADLDPADPRPSILHILRLHTGPDLGRIGAAAGLRRGLIVAIPVHLLGLLRQHQRGLFVLESPLWEDLVAGAGGGASAGRIPVGRCRVAGSGSGRVGRPKGDTERELGEIGPSEAEGKEGCKKRQGQGGDGSAERVGANPPPGEESGHWESGRRLRCPCAHHGDGRR